MYRYNISFLIIADIILASRSLSRVRVLQLWVQITKLAKLLEISFQGAICIQDRHAAPITTGRFPYIIL